MKIRVLFGSTALALAAATVTTMPALRCAVSRSARSPTLRPHRRQRLSADHHGQARGQRPLPAGSSDAGQLDCAVDLADEQHRVGAGLLRTAWCTWAASSPRVRPPGDPLGTGEVARTYLAAFNASTGALITSFDPTITEDVGSRPGCTRWRCRRTATRCTWAASSIMSTGRTGTTWRRSVPRPGALTSWAPTAYGKVNCDRAVAERLGDLPRRRLQQAGRARRGTVRRARWTRRGAPAAVGAGR